MGVSAALGEGVTAFLACPIVAVTSRNRRPFDLHRPWLLRVLVVSADPAAILLLGKLTRVSVPAQPSTSR